MSSGRALDVLDPGVLTTVQDAGRPGLAHLGVPRSGWLDARSARLANRLVGNPDVDGHGGGPGEALLECLGGGLALRTRTALTVALTGAPVDLRVDARPVAYAEPVTVAAGATIVLGRPTSGVRSYLAVAGGVRVPTVLGSRSTDTLSGIGPAALAAGDELPVGPRPGPPAALDTPGRAGTSDLATAATVLRVGPGPRADWFVDGLDALVAGTGPATGAAGPATGTGARAAAYTVAAEADRIGVRLEGPRLTRTVTAELPSEGLVLGAVQVPADGQPLVFLRDHPTTGGYPVVAVVHRDDLDRVAQLRPGDAVRFRRG